MRCQYKRIIRFFIILTNPIGIKLKKKKKALREFLVWKEYKPRFDDA